MAAKAAVCTDGRPKNKDKFAPQKIIYGILEEDNEKKYFWNRNGVDMEEGKVYEYTEDIDVYFTDGNTQEKAEGFVVITGEASGD